MYALLSDVTENRGTVEALSGSREAVELHCLDAGIEPGNGYYTIEKIEIPANETAESIVGARIWRAQ